MKCCRILLTIISANCLFIPILLYSQSVDTAWVRRYNGPGNFDDQANAVAVDNQGNVYVTGFTNNLDYITIKYNSGGDELWRTLYNGTGNGEDEAKAIALDNQGNVYVTGHSLGAGSNHDYATIKYNTNGVEQWVARYNDPTNNWDQACDLAVDMQGNVYVTGNCWDTGVSLDYTTIKYNTNGVEQWVAVYDGPTHSYDQANAIAIDSSGNIFVTGLSYSTGTRNDYVTIKYNQNGVQQWVATYNGTGNSADQANCIVVDRHNNVYVAGSSIGLGTAEDFATVKYNSDGVQQWIARYNGPGNVGDYAFNIAADSTGNIFVTGYGDGAGTAADYTTIKYNPSGIEQWVARYNGTGNASDVAYDIALDRQGNAYVTGYSEGSGTDADYVTIKYNSNGNQEWVVRKNGLSNRYDEATSLTIDSTGYVYVTGTNEGAGGSNDIVTVKYNSSGIEQWNEIYNGPGVENDEAKSMAVDDSGYVYVTGTSDGVGTDEDFLTVKYNSSGDTVWTARYNGPNNGNDDASAIIVDAHSNVYVTGISNGDYTTIKYNSAGAQQWVTAYNGPANQQDVPVAIIINEHGSVYVTGSSTASSTYPYSNDYATVKYDSNGVQQWVARYNGTGNQEDNPRSLALDNDGNVFVAGISESDSIYPYNTDFATVKYNSIGVQQWVARYNGSANDNDEATAIYVDNSGNVYVTGASRDSATNSDYTTIKYDQNGNVQWIAKYNGPVNGDDGARDIALDEQDNVYVTGCSFGAGTYNDYATIKYNPSGIQQWVVRYNGPADGEDVALHISVDEQGSIYVAGMSDNIGSGSDYTTIKYNQSGIQQWVVRYVGMYDGNDELKSLAIDHQGNVYLTGSNEDSLTSEDYVTIKYVQTSGFEEVKGKMEEVRTIEIYPNPARTYFTISLPQTVDRKVIKLFDVTGKEVKSEKQIGKNNRISLIGIKNGVYFVKVGNKMVKGKLVVTR